MSLHRVVVVFEGHFFHRANMDRAGVVNQHIDLPEALAHCVDHLVDLRAVGHVARHGGHTRSDALQFLTRSLKLV